MPPNNRPELVLASQSPYRRALLEKLGLRVRCRPADIDESPLPQETPAKTALRLAEEKARALAPYEPNALIIAGDQLAELDGNALGKPLTTANARDQLSRCSGKSVVFHTALCLLNSATGQSRQLIDPVVVNFRPLSRTYIDAYLEKEDVLDCAGSFKCEGLGICLFESIQANDPNTLQGLPLIQLITLLQAENYSLF
ncbi:MAF protein [Spongiibacter sp. IMCC21906]|uniref:Maf family protein n=1 Tax=Spongiibacter sp. IMCC21906 TaxID=1620392 RepID=UPI00062DE9DC|nr:nucleoside triphosphate pyrophosphatase [Spongiibacter sp. IMCC21906]AKH69830.1 MAF protein [Spongiibacter sp. IMCC21906]